MANIVKYILDITTRKAKKGLEDVGDEAKETGKDLDKAKKSGLAFASQLGSAVTGLASGIGLVTGAISTVVGALEDAAVGVYDFNKSVVDSINDLNDLNAQSALSAQSIQAIKLAFEGSGQSAQQAAGFISRFPRLMADLEAGASRASEAAAKLGLEIRDSSGAMRSSDAILKDAIGSLQQIESDTERTTTAFLLFGRSAGQLLQAFGKTSEFENFLALSEEFGVKTGPEASAAAARFQELLSALNVVVEGTKQAFIEAVGGIDFFNDLLLRTVKLVATVQVLLQDNKKSIGEFSTALGDIGSSIVDLFKTMIQSVQGLIAESVSFMVMKLATPLFILNQIGLISDETFQKIDDLGMATNRAGLALEEVVVGVNTATENSVNAGERVQELVEGILKGINLEGQGLEKDLEGLEQQLKETGKAAKEVDLEENDQMERIMKAGQTIESATAEFLPLEAALKRVQQQIMDLEEASELASFLGIEEGTLAAEKLLTFAREKETDILNKLNGVTEEATGGFESLGNKIGEVLEGIADAIDRISSPESLVGNFGDGFKKLGALATAAGEKMGGTRGSQLSAAGGILAGVGAVAGGVGAVVVALEKLGKSTPKQLEEKFDTFVDNFEKGAKVLPTLIADILPVFIGRLTVAVAEAFISLLFQIPRAIVDGLIEFTFEFMDQLGDALFGWLDRIKDFFNNFGEFFSNIFTRRGRRENRQSILGFESGGRFIPQPNGISFTGGSDGLAMLHRGEYIVPESNRRSQAVDRTMQGMNGGVQIVVNAEIVEQSAIDELVRKIEQRFQGFGGGRSTLFGGV
jgi:hypothetical protein